MTQIISADLVKKLRDITGSGMMNCKNALIETNGDIDQAIDWLRKKGLATASKKAGRVTAEGIVSIKSDENFGIALETNSETDFVSKNDKFKEFVSKITDIAFRSKISDTNELLNTVYENNITIKDKLTELISVIGENLNIRRISTLSVKSGIIASYVHNVVMPSCGKIAVLLAIESDCKNIESLKTLGKHISMHIAASTSLLALQESDISEETLKRERDIAFEQAKQSGKPEAIINKIVDGRIQKFYTESVLIKQSFFMEPEKSIQDVLNDFMKTESCSITLTKYIKYVLGEGIEKEVVDFATEVKNQIK